MIEFTGGIKEDIRVCDLYSPKNVRLRRMQNEGIYGTPDGV
jgi:hypothetical protein